MKLEQSDAELFYQLWFPLLDFVNRKHHVCPETETIGQRKGIDARNAKKTLGCLLLYAARFDAYALAGSASWEKRPTRIQLLFGRGPGGGASLREAASPGVPPRSFYWRFYEFYAFAFAYGV